MAIAEWVLKWRHVARKKTFETRLDIDKEAEIYQKQVNSWVKVFRIMESQPQNAELGRLLWLL